MNENEKHITHQGVVEKLVDNTVVVKILNASACSGCHAKGSCTSADVEEKYIDVDRDGKSYSIGEIVTVELGQSNGLRAVFFAYFLPFLLVLAILIVLTIFNVDDVISAIVSLISLVPYFLILRLFKDKLQKRFKFRII